MTSDQADNAHGEERGTQSQTRRDFLRNVGMAGAMVGAGALLEPPGAPARNLLASASMASRPKRGGTLRVGCTGGSGTDTLDPQFVNTNPDLMRASMLFDSLVTYDANAQAVPQLAEEISPNHDGTVWTIRIPKGIEFHNGKTVTAADMLYTFKRIAAKKADAANQEKVFNLSSKHTRIIDSRTISIACHQPVGPFNEIIVWAAGSGIIPTDFDPKHPVGTGPWKFSSWTPDQQSVFKRFNNYWQSGVPYLDAVEIIEFTDDTAQINALQSGAVDCLAYCEATTIKELQSLGFKTITSAGGYWNPITMRVDQAPFKDVRVRQALRLIVDRPALNKTVFEGFGTIGNDLYGVWDQDFTAFPQRTQDIARAKSLLKQAGAQHLHATIVTSNITSGFVDTATVFAQQAKAAGVNINVQVVPPTTFFGPGYLQRTFSQDVWNYNPYWPQVALCQTPGAPYNETHFNNPRFTKLFQEGNSSLNPAKRKEIARELQAIDYNTGGYIVPVIVPNLSAYASHVHGLAASKCGIAFNSADFRRVWLS